MAMPKAKEIVSSNSVVVFSKSYCPFCVNVKQLLHQLGASFKAIELNQESDGAEIQASLAEWTGQRTVQNVFIGGKHIGGCDSMPFFLKSNDLNTISYPFLIIGFVNLAGPTALHKEGKLVPLLTEAGAIAKASA